MKRRKFFTLTSTFTGGALLLPDFLMAYGRSRSLVKGNECLVFIQLNGGNDGLNTFIPVTDPLYYELRPKVAIAKEEALAAAKGMAWHPSLKGLAQIQQQGHLSVIQNVGYPQPDRSHFRSREIWQTASASDEYLNEGWLGRYLDLQCKDHQPTAGVNVDGGDNLSLRGLEPNSITLKNPNSFKLSRTDSEPVKLSSNPQLDFVRKIASSVTEGSGAIQEALERAPEGPTYAKNELARNLNWIARLIKGHLNTKVYYTSLGGFDTHNNQLGKHRYQLKQLNDAVYSFYNDLRDAKLLESVTVVIFSEFGRRAADNGGGTDHGKAAPMFIIGGKTQSSVLGPNPDLTDLDAGDVRHKIDFRSVYAALLQEKLGFDPQKIGISQKPLQGLFG